MNLTKDDVAEGMLLRSKRSGSLYRVIYVKPSAEPLEPAVAIVECSGLGEPLLNEPVRYCHPQNFDLER
jgi:hypothetical protein